MLNPTATCPWIVWPNSLGHRKFPSEPPEFLRISIAREIRFPAARQFFWLSQPSFRKSVHESVHTANRRRRYFAFVHDLAMAFQSLAEFWALDSGRSFLHSGSMITLPPLEPLVDAKAASAMLGIHRKTVLKLARQGLLPGIRYARHWHFRRKDLVSWVERQLPSAHVAALSDPALPTPPESVHAD